MASRRKSYPFSVRKIQSVAPFMTWAHCDFLRIYGACEDASKASKLANIELASGGSDAYVYFLLDAERKKILYIGKGRGNRLRNHVADARAGRVSTAKKHKALTSLLRKGREPVPVVFASGLDDRSAYRLERALIAWIGTSRLLNSHPGNQRTVFERAALEMRELLERMMPFDEWVAQQPRTQADIDMYNRLKEEIHRVIEQLEAETFFDKLTFWIDADGNPQTKATFKGVEAKLIPPKGLLDR